MGSTRIILSSAPSSGAVVAVGSPCFFDAAIFWAVLATSCPVCFTFLADCCARSPAVLPVCCALPAACCAASFTVLAVWERQKATCCPACCSCSCSGRALRSSSYERRATPHGHQKRGYLLGRSQGRARLLSFRLLIGKYGKELRIHASSAERELPSERHQH